MAALLGQLSRLISSKYSLCVVRIILVYAIGRRQHAFSAGCLNPPHVALVYALLSIRFLQLRSMKQSMYLNLYTVGIQAFGSLLLNSALRPESLCAGERFIDLIYSTRSRGFVTACAARSVASQRRNITGKWPILRCQCQGRSFASSCLAL